jgi:transposase-like protein
MERTPQTLLEAVTFFADPDRAHSYAVQMRWPNGIACPRMGCGSASVQAIATRKTWRCKECKRQFSVRVGTIFEDPPIPFTKWLPAFWLLSNTKNGTSSCELARALGVTQKTAWFMLHRIRETMGTRTFERKFSGVVEADETYIGGKVKNKSKSERRKLRGKGTDDKTAVFGMVERGGNVVAYTVPNAQLDTLLPILRRHVHHDATLYTDAARTYWSMDEHFLIHQMVNHHVNEYVRGAVHTNTVENFWSCLKRTLAGTYIAARPFHLDAYLAEQIFRYNERDDNDGGRFVKALKGADGKRLTYAAVTGSHPRWRLRPGRVARAVARRRALAQPPISGVSDRL